MLIFFSSGILVFRAEYLNLAMTRGYDEPVSLHRTSNGWEPCPALAWSSHIFLGRFAVNLVSDGNMEMSSSIDIHIDSTNVISSTSRDANRKNYLP